MNCPVCGENNVCYECMNRELNRLAGEDKLLDALEYFAPEPKKLYIGSGEDVMLELV